MRSGSARPRTTRRWHAASRERAAHGQKRVISGPAPLVSPPTSARSRSPAGSALVILVGSACLTVRSQIGSRAPAAWSSPPSPRADSHCGAPASRPHPGEVRVGAGADPTDGAARIRGSSWRTAGDDRAARRRHASPRRFMAGSRVAGAPKGARGEKGPRPPRVLESGARPQCLGEAASAS